MSYAALTTMPTSITTDALFRAWGSVYGIRFALMGLIQTSDTGQINWTTVAFPAGANASQGYEIWRFNDALQATVPIFLKIEYGSGAVAADGAIWVTLGSGSNGAGTLNGVLSLRQRITCTASVTAVSHYWSGDTNRFTIAVSNAAASSMFIGVERTIDTSGNVTSEGALLIAKSGTGAWGQVAWNQITGPYTATWETSLGAMGAGTAPFGTFGTQIAIYPVFHNKGIFLVPGLNVFVYESTLIATGSTISFSRYGSTHTYMPLGNTNFGNAGRGGGSLLVAMMRYE